MISLGYAYYLCIVYADGMRDMIGSDNLLFLCELGEDGLKYGRYISAQIEMGDEDAI